MSRKIICCWCNEGIVVDESITYERAIYVMKLHEQNCKSNPMVKKVESLKKDLLARDKTIQALLDKCRRLEGSGVTIVIVR